MRGVEEEVRRIPPAVFCRKKKEEGGENISIKNS
jgi:hypothetical protein